jgi:sulfoxide reductase heme-binding subunit YedZ
LWLLLLITAPVSVFLNLPNVKIWGNDILMVNIFQRVVGLLVYVMLSVQIVIGSNIKYWVQIVGARAYKLHITQGIVAFLFSLVHPLFENVVVYLVSGSVIDSLAVFVPSISTQRDLYMTVGKIALTLMIIAVFTGYFRTKPFLRRNWRVFHILNYLVFFIVFLHSFLIGSDVRNFPFSVIYWAVFLAVSASVLIRFCSYLKE